MTLNKLEQFKGRIKRKFTIVFGGERTLRMKRMEEMAGWDYIRKRKRSLNYWSRGLLLLIEDHFCGWCCSCGGRFQGARHHNASNCWEHMEYYSYGWINMRHCIQFQRSKEWQHHFCDGKQYLINKMIYIQLVLRQILNISDQIVKGSVAKVKLKFSSTPGINSTIII